jgi:hypothetical protein
MAVSCLWLPVRIKGVLILGLKPVENERSVVIFPQWLMKNGPGSVMQLAETATDVFNTSPFAASLGAFVHISGSSAPLVTSLKSQPILRTRL